MKRITFLSTIITLGSICFIIIIFTVRGCDECFSPPVMTLKFFISGCIFVIGSIYFTKEFLKTEAVIFEIDSLPFLKTDGAVEGIPFAGEGIIESETVLKSPYTNTECVYFHSIKEKYIKTEKSSHWEIVENVSRFIPFSLKDERGVLEIDLVNLDEDFSTYKIPFKDRKVPNPAYTEVDCKVILCRDSYKESGVQYRKSEFILKPGTKIFVCGMVLRKNGKLVLHEDKRIPLIISRKNRDQYVKQFYQGSNLIYFVHLLVTIGYTTILLSLSHLLKLNPLFLLMFLLIGNTLIMGSVIFSIYNRIITLRQRTQSSLSNIKVELKRRANLISGLLKIIKEYTKHEKKVQKITSEARTNIRFFKELPKEMEVTIPSLAVTIENHPELKASENFQFLLKTLVDTEERIAYSREFYNRSARKYNVLIKQFPFLLVSYPLGLKEIEFISISRGE